MGRKKANLENKDIKIEWVDPNTPDGKQSWDNGFRILALMIAEAYMKEQKGKHPQPVKFDADVDTGLQTRQPEAGDTEYSKTSQR